MAQISTSSSGTESVLELTYFPSSLLFILSIFRSTQSFPPIKHRLSRVLSVGSSFAFFPRFHRANDFHRHVPRHCEIKPLTIALIIRGTRGRGCCWKERTVALRFSNVTWENRSRGYQSVISHDIGERYSRNRGRDRLFMQLQRPYVS